MSLAPSSPVVLVVESDVLVRTPIAGYLRECGFKVVEAVNGAEAITVLQDAELSVEVILTEAALSNGSELLTRIWSAPPRVDSVRLRI